MTTLPMPYVPGDRPHWSPGEYFRAYVDSRRFTQQEMADLMGVTRATINAWCRQRIAISRNRLLELRLVCGAAEANTRICAARFPEYYRKHRNRQPAIVRHAGYDNPNPASGYTRNGLHPGAETVADLFKGKPSVTVHFDASKSLDSSL